MTAERAAELLDAWDEMTERHEIESREARSTVADLVFRPLRVRHAEERRAFVAYWGHLSDGDRDAGEQLRMRRRADAARKAYLLSEQGRRVLEAQYRDACGGAS